MFVVKRNGQKQPVQFDKITARIVKLCYGLNTDFVDPILVAQKVTAGTPLIAIFISSLPIVFTVPLSAVSAQCQRLLFPCCACDGLQPAVLLSMAQCSYATSCAVYDHIYMPHMCCVQEFTVV